MNDETVYGPEFHRLSFGDAVDRGLLTDYKVLVLIVDEELVAARTRGGEAQVTKISAIRLRESRGTPHGQPSMHAAPDVNLTRRLRVYAEHVDRQPTHARRVF